MTVKETDGGISLHGVHDFELAHIFECGQCFRWDRTDDESYVGIADGKAIEISKTNDTVILKNTTKEEFDLFWRQYFDLDFDYKSLKQELSKDKILASAIKSGEGIRILNQDLWECIISFIISANNNIPRIKGIIKSFCQRYGDKITLGSGEYYSFPSADKLRCVETGDLAPLKMGYRDKYIVDAIQKVTCGEVDLEFVKKAPYEDAKSELLKIKGVGSKVADCILLFGAGKKNAFPVDVWIKRVIETLYKDEIKDKDILTFAKEKFGDFGGYAQQYLFYHMRETSKKK